MSSIIYRSFADSMGWKWPKEIAMIVNGETVTWEQIKDERRSEQKRRLEVIRTSKPTIVSPCYVWTFKVPGAIYGGWWCYIVTRKEMIPVNFRCFVESLAMSLMREIPLTVPTIEKFEDWMIALAEYNPRKHPTDPRKAGIAIGWYNRNLRTFSLKKHVE